MLYRFDDQRLMPLRGRLLRSMLARKRALSACVSASSPTSLRFPSSPLVSLAGRDSPWLRPPHLALWVILVWVALGEAGFSGDSGPSGYHLLLLRREGQYRPGNPKNVGYQR